ncbi:type II toxin-antitoxin system VapC family toxin [Deinococcus sp.]|uniref:type II toxin-antitoxin system VapC family toxin n=1 Tax=Deinococcus sp. TaxID=47478 RepID=UPI003B5AB659
MSDAVVLDTSAVIAYLLDEPGAARVATVMAGSLLSSVNLCEIVSKFAERGEDAARVQADVLALGLEVVDFSPPQALIAAALRPQTRHLGLSLGDRACLALALEHGAIVLTADKPWQNLPAPYQIEVIR